MALPVYTSSAFTGQNGLEIAAEASVEVRSEADDSLVTLYEDRDGAEQINNPFQADEYGRFAFFAEPNVAGWRITVTSGDDTHTLRYQQPMGAVGGVQPESFIVDLLTAEDEEAARAALGAADAAGYAALGASNVFTANQTVRKTSGGSTVILHADHDTPGTLAGTNYNQDNDSGDETIMAQVEVVSSDLTDGSEDALMRFRTIIAGTLATRFNIGAGLWTEGATGGDPGAGNINVSGYQVDGEALPFQKVYESEEQTIVSAGQRVLAHGLGVRPGLVRARLKCVVAEAGYSVGDEIEMDIGATPSFQASHQGMTVKNDSTNLTVRYGSNPTVFFAINASTGDLTSLTNNSWRLILLAWA